ncbi:MAG: sigma-70 family RNA polymerase sigma factor [Phycisphaerales bacterium]|nr:sigma-70 family RNA polymerase sigma factor [Phycisphaerales bacterium]
MPADAEQQKADLALMQAVATGDKAAVAQLYDRFESLVYRMAVQALPTREEAEDAVQEIFVRLWRTSSRYDPTRAALVTWVMLISRRYLVDRLRRARTSLKGAPLDERLAPAKAGREGRDGLGESISAETRERFGSLMKRVEELPELQRTVIIRAYLNGQTLRQIGEELNTPLGTIKSALSRALMRLRERDMNEGLSA